MRRRSHVPYGLDKRPALINADALWLLAASAMALRCVPGLTSIEDRKLAEAIAAATKALNDAPVGWALPKDGNVLGV